MLRKLSNWVIPSFVMCPSLRLFLKSSIVSFIFVCFSIVESLQFYECYKFSIQLVPISPLILAMPFSSRFMCDYFSQVKICPLLWSSFWYSRFPWLWSIFHCRLLLLSSHFYCLHTFIGVSKRKCNSIEPLFHPNTNTVFTQ